MDPFQSRAYPVLTQEHELVRRTARDFAESRLQTVIDKMYNEEHYPRKFLPLLGKMGYLSFGVPLELGGISGGCLTSAIVLEELSRIAPEIAGIINITTMVSWIIANYGDEEQKKLIEPIIKGDKVVSYALTEPAAGSDAAAIRTEALRKNGTYLVRGEKAFITNGAYADLYAIFVRTGGMEDRYRGLSLLLVDRNTPNFKIGKEMEIMGSRGTGTANLIFDGVEVPISNRVGKEGQGFAIAMEALNLGRTAIAASALGMSQMALEKSIAYSKTRIAFERPIIHHEGIGFKLADMATRTYTSRMLTYHAAYLRDMNLPYVTEACMAKLHSTESAVRNISDAIQIHGGSGLQGPGFLSRFYRIAKVFEIVEGTSEIQRLVISRKIAGDGE